MPAQTIVTNLGTTMTGNVLQPEWVTTFTNDILDKENDVVDLHFSENETISIPNDIILNLSKYTDSCLTSNIIDIICNCDTDFVKKLTENFADVSNTKHYEFSNRNVVAIIDMQYDITNNLIGFIKNLRQGDILILRTDIEILNSKIANYFENNKITMTVEQYERLKDEFVDYVEIYKKGTELLTVFLK